MNDVLSDRGFDESYPIKMAQKAGEPVDVGSGSEPREMMPACSVASASSSRLKKVLAPAVHFVAWNNFPRNFCNFLIGIEPEEKSSRQNSRASSTLAGSMAMVSLMVSKTTPIQVMIVVGPSHLSGAASNPS